MTQRSPSFSHTHVQARVEEQAQPSAEVWKFAFQGRPTWAMRNERLLVCENVADAYGHFILFGNHQYAIAGLDPGSPHQQRWHTAARPRVAVFTVPRMTGGG